MCGYKNSELQSLKVSKKNVSSFNKRTQDTMWGYIMIAPLMLGLFIFNILPILETVVYSFSRYKGFEPIKLIGLGNYAKLLHDPNLLISLRNTILFAIMMVPISIIISIIIATLLNSNMGGVKIFRTIYFLPQVTLPAAVAMAWMWLFNSDYGLINQFLVYFSYTKDSMDKFSKICFNIPGNCGYMECSRV